MSLQYWIGYFVAKVGNAILLAILVAICWLVGKLIISFLLWIWAVKLTIALIVICTVALLVGAESMP